MLAHEALSDALVRGEPPFRWLSRGLSGRYELRLAPLEKFGGDGNRSSGRVVGLGERVAAGEFGKESL